MNDMAYSSPHSSLCVITGARELSKAKVYRIKYFSKSWLLSEGGWDIETLIFSNAPCQRLDYLCKNQKQGLCTKFIVPVKDCMPFLLWIKGIFSIASILSGSMEVPFLEMM